MKENQKLSKDLKVIKTYSYQTSFGKKHDHFSLLCKQMEFIQEKCTLSERLPQCRHFWPSPILVCVTYIARDEF